MLFVFASRDFIKLGRNVSVFFFPMKVNDGSGVLCDMTNQNENIQVGYVLLNVKLVGGGRGGCKAFLL